jgi:hypothetical protein
MQVNFYTLYSWENADDFCIIMTSAVLVVSYVLHFLCNPQKLNFNQVITDVRLFIFLSLILAFLTPVLQSLTVSSSDDTIILFVLIFSFFHLLLHDYTYVSLNNKPVKSKFDFD